MPEVRDTTIVIHIETTFATMLKELCKDKVSISSYIRQLIIEDLMENGKIDEKAIKKILIG